MARVRKREAAKRDLVETFVWYVENASVEVADRFLEAADATLHRLAEVPESGIPVLTQRGNSAAFAVGQSWTDVLSKTRRAAVRHTLARPVEFVADAERAYAELRRR